MSLHFLRRGKDQKSRYDEIRDEVEETRQEWRRIKEQLDDLTDPDLVDSAIYQLKSLEKRCMFLMKELKAVRSKVV